MLKNYIQLEMLRFENKFNFILQVDPETDAESIEIPSLLIEKNDAVIFQIEDDGIGREAAKKLREQNFPTHKSMGIKLTEEHLQLINQKHNVVFEIQDLKNESGPIGTCVRIGVI